SGAPLSSMFHHSCTPLTHHYIMMSLHVPSTTDIYTLSLHDALPISPDSIVPSSTPTRRFPGPVPAGGRHAFSCSCSSLSSSASDWRPGPDSTPGPWTCSPRPSTGERALATASPPPLSPYSGSMSGLSEEQTRRVVALAMDLARQGWTEELLEFLDHGLPANTQDED